MKKTSIIMLTALLLKSFCMVGCSTATSLNVASQTSTADSSFESSLSEDEEIIKGMLKDYIKQLDDTSNLKIRGDINMLYFTDYKLNKDKIDGKKGDSEYLILDFAGPNGFGGIKTKTLVFYNGIYISDYDSIKDMINDLDYTRKHSSDVDERMSALNLQFDFEFIIKMLDLYKDNGIPDNKSFVVGVETVKVYQESRTFSGKAIADALGCEYSEI